MLRTLLVLALAWKDRGHDLDSVMAASYVLLLLIQRYNLYKVLACSTTGWGKISSVGHSEGRGGRRRVGLGSKGAGSRQVPVTTLPSRKDGVVQRAVRICRQNLLFAKSLYRSGPACIPYSLPNPPSRPSTGPKIHSVVG